ncbi:uncharacterized protein LOC124942773 [Impatiens glandulifera]|uniref:uncharacterized protein LOC124942773 n=1 Tax=Impatiens glandulifera TaxID=253017 RepID=UPI001FB0F112|nr:uncharacterized protein LOC124942773 [Impatiens glandulifera]
MKLVWSPELASKAYIDTVKACETINDSSVAELISATAAGWNATLIVETWCQGNPIATSIGLTIASHHTNGKHICIVPNDETAAVYIESMRIFTGETPDILIGNPEQSAAALTGIDFLVVDCGGGNELVEILRVAKLGQRGAVLVCKNANLKTRSEFRWRSAFGGGSRRVVRTVFLPVGNGLEIAHVAAVGNSSGDGDGNGKRRSRWFKHVNPDSGEDYFIRK